jgi:hypothetical protein
MTYSNFNLNSLHGAKAVPNLRQPTAFAGSLGDGERSVPVTFRAWIDETGEVRFDFDDIPATREVIEMQTASFNARVRVPAFTIVGVSDSGVEFSTTRVHFGPTSLHGSQDSPMALSLSGRCQEGRFDLKSSRSSPVPVLRYQLRGFKCTETLTSTSTLGTIQMGVSSDASEFDAISGVLQVSAAEGVDLVEWRGHAEELLSHIRSVMSFAAGAMLGTPVVEFFTENRIEIVTRSPTKQSRSAIQVIHHHNLRSIFETAIRDFFEPARPAQSLFFATEWLVMDTTYNEARLINAMTALENLIEANLSKDAKSIQPERQFEKLRKAVGQMIRDHCARIHEGDQESATQVANAILEKRAELNRRSLIDKLYVLATQWNASLDGISEEQIQAAKSGRDRIVHRGRYYRDGDVPGNDLWIHVTIVRELVVRLVLTALRYQGAYVSYIGGYHVTNLPQLRKSESTGA